MKQGVLQPIKFEDKLISRIQRGIFEFQQNDQSQGQPGFAFGGWPALPQHPQTSKNTRGSMSLHHQQRPVLGAYPQQDQWQQPLQAPTTLSPLVLPSSLLNPTISSKMKHRLRVAGAVTDESNNYSVLTPTSADD